MNHSCIFSLVTLQHYFILEHYHNLSNMASITKLEISCLKSVIDSEFVIDSESIPAHLVKKIKEMRAINGKYISQDNLDSISSIEINYDGETNKLSFMVCRKIHRVVFNKQMLSPINTAILRLVQLNEDALMEVEILSEEDVTIVKLTCKDSGWQWKLSLEIRYLFCYNKGLIIQIIFQQYWEGFAVEKGVAKKNIQGEKQMVDRTWQGDVFNIQKILISSKFYVIDMIIFL